MNKHRARLGAVLSAGLAAFVTMTGSAGAASITGFSDQEIGRPGAGDWTQTAHTIADILRPQVQQARFQVRWDVAALPASNADVVTFETWLRAVADRGMRPLVTFMPNAPSPPSRATYQGAMATFRARYPQVTEFTPWNEPNHPNTAVPYTTAVDYLEALMAVCGSSCTVAAGDFSGSRTNHAYYGNYVAEVAARGLNPSVWAYHPYEVVNNGTATDRFDGLRYFLGRIGSGKPVWFTEVGAYFCVNGTWSGPAGQDAAAARLTNLIADPRWAGQVTRVYYYHLAGDWTPGGACNWDTGLLNHPADLGGAPRPALKTLFPQVRGHWWSLTDTHSGAPSGYEFAFQKPGTPLAGDWDGNGRDGPATFDAPQVLWSWRNAPTSGPPNADFFYGMSDGIPVTGDWNGDGVDTPGLFHPPTATWYLRNSNSCCAADITFSYGFPTGVPLVGDWNNDGIDTPAIYNPDNAIWYLRNSNTTGVADASFIYGVAGIGDVPVVGDWNGDGVDTPGVFRPSTAIWSLRNSNSPGTHDISFIYGVPGDTRIVIGDWNGDGVDSPGIVR